MAYHTEHPQHARSFRAKLVDSAAGTHTTLQSKGAQIMKIAEAIRPHIAQWLAGCKTPDGLPVQPATVRAVALNTAQNLLKQQHA